MLEKLQQEKLQQALALHQRGNLVQAQSLYEQMLQVDPAHSDALHLLGVVAVQTNNPDRAVDLISRAIRLKPGDAMQYFNRGSALQALKQWTAALADYDSAIALAPAFAEAYCNRCVVEKELGLLDRALASADRAIAHRTAFAEAHFNRGLILQQQRRWDEALASYDQAVALRGGYAEAHFNRGNLLKALERHEAALASYDRAIACRLNYGEALANRGSVQEKLHQWEAALESYNRVVAIRPGDAVAHMNRANVLTKLRRFDAALLDYDRAVVIEPELAAAYCNRGSALAELHQWEGALANFERAIAIDRGFAEAHFNRGNVLRELERFDPALASYDAAIALKPDYAEAHCNRGVALAECNRLQEALASYDAAVRLRPAYAQARYNRAFVRLLRGDLTSGWPDHELRWSGVAGTSREERRDFRQPLWLGEEPIAGKTILLHDEQGLGDTLQFCRYVSEVAALGARVIFEVQKPLKGLLEKLPGASRTVARGETLPEFDYRCPLLSLPLAFETVLGTIPRAAGYVAADAGKIARWRLKLGVKIRPRIGLVWSGSTVHKNDHNRSLPLSALLDRLPPDLQYVSLQKDVRPIDRKTLLARREILDFADELTDFGETAALCECLDLVITVDTSVAHLCGALGKPTWILLPFHPDWRWMLERTDSPWYPSVKLYRQAARGDWGGVLERVKADLASASSSFSAG
jgi:tetratricopeptide (TPR) repeat protein